MSTKKSIAIVGSGIGGLASAWLLSRRYHVTVFEKNDYLGGHTNTRPARFGDKVVWADTGFMVFNHETYPNMVKFFAHLGVKTEETDMSFGVSLNKGGFEFSSDNVFVQKRNMLQPSFWNMLFDITRFNREVVSVARRHGEELSLRALLKELRVGDRFCEQYLLPMAGAIWSTHKENILDYPAKQFVSFCENHGLLNPKTLNPFNTGEGRLQWYTVTGGARSYVEKVRADMEAEMLLSTGIRSIRRSGEGVAVVTEQGVEQLFDYVVCASHPDQTLKMLEDATPDEQSVLGAFSYTKNQTVMHRDTSYMMKHTRRWPSWTYAEPQEKKVELSYYMNRLQHIDPALPVIVTLNPTNDIPREDVFYEVTYEHPRFSLATDQAQQAMARVQGQRGIYFAGAWLGHGFHEDGLRSALGVAEALGVAPPWHI